MMIASDETGLQRPDLPADHVDLWCSYLDRTTAPAQLEQYHALLNEKERAHLSRLRLPRIREEYLVARALVRSVLSLYADIPPENWDFSAEDYGKPVVKFPWDGFGTFNLSHSAGMVICAVAAGGQIGADVESLDRKTTGISLARRFFSPAEVELLRQAPQAERQELFLQIWTLKESYIKAIGQGLSMPLDRFFFALPGEGPPELYFTDQAAHPQTDWQFAQLRMSSRHHISVAISAATVPSNWVLHAQEIIPLQGVVSLEPMICSEANHWYVANG